MKFTEKLKQAIQTSKSVLCVGLDPIPERFPVVIKQISDDPVIQTEAFCKAVIDASSPYCAAFKPNLGFFEALGARGIKVFEDIIHYIPEGKIIIADAKRGDIGNTAHHYKKAYFDTWNCDAVTLSPLMGVETLTPFLTTDQKCIYVLTLTSNPGSDDFFKMQLSDNRTLSDEIARQCGVLNERFPGQVGMVLGATQTDAFSSLLSLNPDGPVLIPGVGVQGGDIKALQKELETHKGLPLINVSRGILYGPEPNGDVSGAIVSIATRAKEFQTALLPISSRYLGR